MSDDKRYNDSKTDELESSLEDLLTLAFNKKNGSGTKQSADFNAYENKPEISVSQANTDEGAFDTSAYDVDEIVAQANALKNSGEREEKAYRATVRKIEPEAVYDDKESDDELLSVSQEDDAHREMSIEDMVANAMAVRKGGKSKAVERVATEDEALSKEELDELLANDKMYNQLVEHKEKPEKKKWYQNTVLIVGLAVLGVFLLMLGIVLVVFLNYYNKLKDDTVYVPQPGNQAQVSPEDTVDAFDYEKWLKEQLSGIADNTMSNENVTNILIIAEDLRDTTGDSRGNTDVMILASINKEMETITLTSFMRDIYCDIPGYYADRLNSAYAKGGPEVLMQTLQTNFGVVVDKYVLVNFYSFIDVVEAIGGIEADVTQAHIDAMRDPLSEQNDIMGNKYGTDFIKEPGHYNLNGNQALAYARIRYGVGDDFGRTSRQREVIFTAVNKAKELSFGEIKKLVDGILEKDMVKTNLTEGEVASLLINCFEYMDYTQQQLQVPDNSTWTGVRIRGMEVLSINFLKNAKIIQETIYGESNIDLGNNGGDYVNTYAPQSTTTQAPIVTTPPTTTTPPATTTPPVSTTPPSTTTPTDTSDTISGDTTTTPPETSGSDISSESSSSDVSGSDVPDTTPPEDTTTTPSTTPTESTTPETTPPVTTTPPVVVTEAPTSEEAVDTAA